MHSVQQILIGRSLCLLCSLAAVEGVLPSGRRLRDGDARDGYGCILSDAGSWKNRRIDASCELSQLMRVRIKTSFGSRGGRHEGDVIALMAGSRINC